MTPFAALSLPVQLTLSEEEIKAAYEATARSEAHLSARNTLLSPAPYLRAWMEATGLAPKRHAPIPEQLIPLFSQLSEVVHTVAQLAGKKAEASSLLAQTLIEKQLFQQKPQLDELAATLMRHRQTALSHFPALQDSPDEESANILLQALKFIQKWEQELDKAYTQLL